MSSEDMLPLPHPEPIESARRLKWLLIFAAGGWLLYILVALWVSNDLALAGQFGDMLGAFNALVTAFAFAALVFTIDLQREDLRMQRTELRDTRVELEGQKLALQQQNEYSRIQTFENTFFQLLRLHNEIVDALSIIPSHHQSSVKGRLAFERYRHELKTEYESRVARNKSASNNPEFIDESYFAVYRKYQSAFGHYFRHLYHILRFIADADIPDKRRYARFARAQLSTDELVCIFYNCISREGQEKFRPLAEKFALFNNIDPNQLFRSEHATLLNPTAFANGAA